MLRREPAQLALKRSIRSALQAVGRLAGGALLGRVERLGVHRLGAPAPGWSSAALCVIRSSHDRNGARHGWGRRWNARGTHPGRRPRLVGADDPRRHPHDHGPVAVDELLERSQLAARGALDELGSRRVPALGTRAASRSRPAGRPQPAPGYIDLHPAIFLWRPDARVTDGTPAPSSGMTGRPTAGHRRPSAHDRGASAAGPEPCAPLPPRWGALEDLEQTAYVGLVKAVDRFDPERGTFPAFAIPTILGELRRHFRDRGWSLKVPRRIQERSLAVERETEASAPRSCARPAAEIAERTGLALEEVLEAHHAAAAHRSLPLVVEGGGEDDSGVVTDPGAIDDGFARAEDRATIVSMLGALKPYEREIVMLRFHDELSQREIGRRVGISQMSVSRVLRRSFERMRTAAE